ncbi:MAG: hypothetical protein OXC62_03855 [Aestuariivita sp.]|nr:hypothetical protein [Aestuariivita sp.]
MRTLVTLCWRSYVRRKGGISCGARRAAVSHSGIIHILEDALRAGIVPICAEELFRPAEVIPVGRPCPLSPRMGTDHKSSLPVGLDNQRARTGPRTDDVLSVAGRTECCSGSCPNAHTAGPAFIPSIGREART